MRTIIIAFAFTTVMQPFSIGVAKSADWIPDFLQSDEELFCQRCEDVLLKRLKSPSSYSRSACLQLSNRQVDLRSYFNFTGDGHEDLTTTVRRQIDDGRLLLTRYVLEYEAENSFGASLRSEVICEILRDDGQSLVEAARFAGPKVDGYTSSEWLVEGIKSLNK